MHRKTPEKKKRKRPASAAADGETKKKATTTAIDLNVQVIIIQLSSIVGSADGTGGGLGGRERISIAKL